MSKILWQGISANDLPHQLEESDPPHQLVEPGPPYQLVCASHCANCEREPGCVNFNHRQREGGGGRVWDERGASGTSQKLVASHQTSAAVKKSVAIQLAFAAGR